MTTTKTRNEFVPFLPVPPRATLRDLMLERGVSRAALARDMGVPAEDVERLLSDEADAPITPDLAERLVRAGMGPMAEFWTRCESEYRQLLKTSG